MSSQQSQSSSVVKPSDPPSIVNTTLSKALFITQYIIAAIQGVTIYIISASVSIAQLIQYKIFGRSESRYWRSIYPPTTYSLEKEEEEEEEEEESSEGSDIEWKVSGGKREERTENRQVFDFSDDQPTSLLMAHVAIQKFWAVIAAVGDQVWYFSRFVTTVTTIDHDPNVHIHNNNQEWEKGEIQNESVQDKDNYSKRFRKALVRTISGNLIPQIKRVTFDDRIVVLDKSGQTINETQTITSKKSTSAVTLPDLTMSLNTTTTRIIIQQGTILPSPVTPISSSYSSLMAPATPCATTATAKTTIAAAMSMTIPISVGSTISDNRIKDISSQDNNSSLRRSTSTPSKSSTFLQRYKQDLLPRQRQQQQQGIKAEEMLSSLISRQEDSNTIEISSDSSGVITTDTASTCTPGLVSHSLGTRLHRSISLIRPRSIHVDGATAAGLSSALSDSKSQDHCTMRRRSFDHDNRKPGSIQTSETHSSLITHQQNSARVEGEHRNFIYRIAHPHKYKREMEQLQQKNDA